VVCDHRGADLQSLGDRPGQDVEQEALRSLPLRLKRAMCSITLFHEVSEHYVRAQGEPHNVQHEEGDHKACRERRRVSGQARVQQREHHELGEERYEPHN
jgi:hypothetical protein